jgi:hypothetical protein
MDFTKEEFLQMQAKGLVNSQATYEDYLKMRQAQRELDAEQRAAMPEYERRILEQCEADFKARKARERQAA